MELQLKPIGTPRTYDGLYVSAKVTGRADVSDAMIATDIGIRGELGDVTPINPNIA